MRSHWLSDLTIQDEYRLAGDSLHHLVHVVRIELDETLLLQNGHGLFVETKVNGINKKELSLSYLKHYEKERSFEYDLILAMPKKDALDLCFKEATELGIRNIILVKSEYSQGRVPDDDRLEKLLVSALEQSNAPYLPVVSVSNWQEIRWESYRDVTLLDSQSPSSEDYEEKELSPRALVIGPEGGFSQGEIEFLHSIKNLKVVNLPTPILRTPTAVATGVGILLQSLLK